MSDLVWGVLGGHSAFHLYFLVVTLQVYLAFPLLLRLVRAARRSPLALAGAALVYELLAMWWVHDLSPDTGAGGWLADKAYVLAPTYLFWVVLGMLCAQHLPAVQSHLVTHRRRVAGAGLLAVATGLGWYAWRVAAGASPADSDASATLQPVMVVLSLGVIALLALASTGWAMRPAGPPAPGPGRGLVLLGVVRRLPGARPRAGPRPRPGTARAHPGPGRPAVGGAARLAARPGRVGGARRRPAPHPAQPAADRPRPDVAGSARRRLSLSPWWPSPRPEPQPLLAFAAAFTDCLCALTCSSVSGLTTSATLRWPSRP